MMKPLNPQTVKDLQAYPDGVLLVSPDETVVRMRTEQTAVMLRRLLRPARRAA